MLAVCIFNEGGGGGGGRRNKPSAGCRRFPSPSLRGFRERPIFPSPFPFLAPATQATLNASLESFVHKALKDEQIECIHRIVCYGRDVLAVPPTGLGKSALYQFQKGRTANATSQTAAELLVFLLAYKVERYASETCSLRMKQEDVFYKINHIFVGRTVQHCMTRLPVILLGSFLSGDGIAHIHRQIS